MASIIKRAERAIKHRIGQDDESVVWRIRRDPPEIEPDSIVFTSSDDYTGNPRALFLYMIENGFNERYRITWLFEFPEKLIDFEIPNVSSIAIYNKDRKVTPEAQRAIMSARYVFYSHNVNWCRVFREVQTFINLWHGCGYKGNVSSDKRKIYYDYVIVTGRKYIEVFKEHLKDPDGNILDLGYPRNESFRTQRSQAKALIDDMKRETGASRALMWLPTYRKSRLARLSSDTGMGETGLPILYTERDLEEFDSFCRERSVLVVLKKHMLASDFGISGSGLSNIRLIDEDWLRRNDADLYEMFAASDALFTDYSSAAIDYMLLDRPIGYALDDFDRYGEARSWCLDDVKGYMPGHHIYTMDDLKCFIEDISAGKDPHSEWRHRIVPEIHTYTSDFSRRIIEYFGI